VNVFPADLHIHTGLSPCAADEMTPPAIVDAAVRSGLSMIAICDHNAAGNTAATQRAAGKALTVLAGMEVTSAEEVHTVGLFPGAGAAVAAADEVAGSLPETDDDYAVRFGQQWLMDADGHITGAERRMLAAATPFALSEVVDLIHRHGGVAVAAHVNRPSFSVISQLGVFPQDAGFDAIEVFSPPGRPSAGASFSSFGLPLLCSSDSHYLGDIGRVRTELLLEKPTFEEFVLALGGRDGRRVAHA